MEPSQDQSSPENDQAEPDSKNSQAYELPKSVSVIDDGERKIYLIGTAHVSARSVDEVDQLIKNIKPDTVVVELCQARLEAIDRPERWENTNIYKIIKEGKGMILLANILLSSFQKQIGDKLGVKPGAEMVKAIELARDKDINLVLGDRNVQTTLKRTWAGFSMVQKSKLLTQLVKSYFTSSSKDITEDDLELMKDKDILTELLLEMGKVYPAILEHLIHERDLYLMNSISKAEGQKVVAVVGAGHCPGILKHWKEEVDIHKLDTTPKSGYALKVIKWSIPIMILAAFAFFFLRSTEEGIDVMKIWLLSNAICAGIGAALAFGHPLTILSAVLAAPFTSLNPLVAAGWVAGLVEAIIRKPKVSDAQTLQEDVGSIKGFYRNGITRVLLVVALSNLGSAVGTWIATGDIFINYVWEPLKSFLTGG